MACDVIVDPLSNQMHSCNLMLSGKLRNGLLMRALLIGFILVATHAHAADKRFMILCRSPLIANDYWNDVLSVNSMGLQIDLKTVATLTKKHGCNVAISDNLKPVKIGWGGMFQMSDGTHEGWATPHSYVIYVNPPQSN